MDLRMAEHIVPSRGTFCRVRGHSGLLFQGIHSGSVRCRILGRMVTFKKSICGEKKVRYSQMRGFDYAGEHITSFDAEQVSPAPSSAYSHPHCL